MSSSDSDTDSSLSSLEEPDFDDGFDAKLNIVKTKARSTVVTKSTVLNTIRSVRSTVNDSLDAPLVFRDSAPPMKWIDLDEDLDAEEAEFELRQEMGQEEESSNAGRLDPLGYIPNSDPAFQASSIAKQYSSKASIVNEAINIHSTNFDPVQFLITIHKSTTFEKLKQGLTYLERTCAGRTTKMKRLVLRHFSKFVHCKDTIDLIQQLVRKDVVESSSGVLVKTQSTRLNSTLSLVHEKSDVIFESLLQKRMESERIRSTLHTVKKFKLLLELPGQVTSHIQNGRVEQVIHDYRRAKSIQVPDKPEAEVLRKILAEVMRICSEYTHVLLARLDDPRVSVEVQQRVMGHLIDLDCPVDPAWHYLERQCTHICGLIDAAYRSRTLSIQQLQRRRVKDEGERTNDDSVESTEAMDRLDATMCSQILSIAQSHLPLFLKLGQAVATGTVTASITSSSTYTGAIRNAYEISAEAHSAIMRMISSILAKCVLYIRVVVFPSGSAASVAGLPEVSSRIAELSSLGDFVLGDVGNYRLYRALDLAVDEPTPTVPRPSISINFMAPPTNMMVSSVLPDQTIYCDPLIYTTHPDGMAIPPRHTVKLRVHSNVSIEEAAQIEVQPVQFLRLPPYLKTILPELGNVLVSLLEQPLSVAKPDILLRLTLLYSDLSAHVTEQSFRNACIRTSGLAEQWVCENSNASSAPATLLPLRFNEVMTETLDWAAIVPSHPRLIQVIAHTDRQLPSYALIALFLEAVLCFADRIHSLAFASDLKPEAPAAADLHSREHCLASAVTLNTEREESIVMEERDTRTRVVDTLALLRTIQTSAHSSSALSSFSAYGATPLSPGPERQLLCCLSNVMHTTHRTLPALWRRVHSIVQRHWATPTDNTDKNAKRRSGANEEVSMTVFNDALDQSYAHALQVYGGLEMLLFNAYVQSKTRITHTYIAHALFKAGVNWRLAAVPSQLRPFVVDTLLEVVQSQAEIAVLHNKLCGTIISTIAEEVVAQWCASVRQIPILCYNGVMLLKMETLYLQHMLEYVLPSGAASALTRLLSHLENHLAEAVSYEGINNKKLKKARSSRDREGESWAFMFDAKLSQGEMDALLKKTIDTTQTMFESLRPTRSLKTRSNVDKSLLKRYTNGEGGLTQKQIGNVQVILGLDASDIYTRSTTETKTSKFEDDAFTADFNRAVSIKREEKKKEKKEKKSSTTTVTTITTLEISDDEEEHKKKKEKKEKIPKPVIPPPEPKPEPEVVPMSDDEFPSTFNRTSRRRSIQTEKFSERKKTLEELEAEVAAEKKMVEEKKPSPVKQARRKVVEEPLPEPKPRRPKPEPVPEPEPEPEPKPKPVLRPKPVVPMTPKIDNSALLNDDADHHRHEQKKKILKMRVKKLKDGRYINMETGEEVIMAEKKVINMQKL